MDAVLLFAQRGKHLDLFKFHDILKIESLQPIVLFQSKEEVMSQKNVLIVSNSDDAHATAIHVRLKERSIRACRLDSDRFASGQHSWRIYSAANYKPHSSWFIPDVDVVWYRKVKFLESTDVVQSFINQETQGLFDCVLAGYRDCRWVNPRERIAEARPKIMQLQHAANIGLRIPDTLITTNIDALKEFSVRHNGQIVAKPIQAQVVGSADTALVVGTRQLTSEDFESATKFSPCYAQERLPLKSEIRVVVFGDRLYPFRLTAKEKADDLKQLKLSQIDHERCELDESTSQKIRSLMSFYNLEFGAIDLAVVDDEAPVFLELNPNGQWLWLQYMTGENLIDPFIDFLCS